LGDWLVEEMNCATRFRSGSSRVGSTPAAGVAAHGLDEVRESIARLRGRNQWFVLEHMPAGLAVTCRVGIFRAAGAPAPALGNLPPALTPAQIDAYFAGPGRTGQSPDGHADGRGAAGARPNPADVERDDDGLAGPPAAALQASEAATVEQRRRQFVRRLRADGVASQGAKEGEGLTGRWRKSCPGWPNR